MGKSKFCGTCGEVREHTHILAQLWICSGCGKETRMVYGGKGRPPVLSPDKLAYAKDELKAGRTVKALVRKLRVSAAVIYRIKRELRKGQGGLRGEGQG